MWIIDPPSLFDDRAEWERHLAKLEELVAEHPGDADLEAAITNAKAHLASFD